MREEKEVRKMEFGDVIVSSKGFPQIQVRPEGNTEWRYLSPHGGYMFMVSDDVEGEDERASTPIIGLKNLVETYMILNSNRSWCASDLGRKDSIKYILDQLAFAAISDYARTNECTKYDFCVTTIDPDVFNYDIFRRDDDPGKKMDEFIDKTYEYLAEC